jgi:hypothetical protein
MFRKQILGAHMSTSTIRATLICGSIMLAALSSFPAIAELPTHRTVVQLGPTAVESDFNGEEPFPKNNSDFGAAVAIRNGIAFVGIPNALPTAHVAVYGQTATGWVRTSTLSVPDPVPVGLRSNGFGSALTFRDGLAVIASYSFVHVFRRVDGVWTDVQKFEPPPNPTGLDLWKISAMRYENGILAIGWNHFIGDSLVQLYELASNGKFVKRATLRAPDGAAAFGADVGIAGNVLVVGADSAAYVFRRRSDGTWVRTQKLIAADSSPVSSFGAAVAIDQGMIIVGAPEHDCVGGSVGVYCSGGSAGGAGGAAYGFVPFSGQYVQVFKLRPGVDEHSNYFQFGRRIAMMGKFVVIDAAEQVFLGDPDFFNQPPGMAFTYTRDGSTLTARGLARGYVLSHSMGLANNWLLVGSRFDKGFCLTLLGACFGEARVFDLNRFAEPP